MRTGPFSVLRPALRLATENDRSEPTLWHYVRGGPGRASRPGPVQNADWRRLNTRNQTSEGGIPRMVGHTRTKVRPGGFRGAALLAVGLMIGLATTMTLTLSALAVGPPITDPNDPRCARVEPENVFF